MAETRHCPYSFYVPENDEQLMRFVKAQSNLSLSVRLLMKAFIAANRGAMRDVGSEDLLELIQSVGLDGMEPAAAAGKARTERQEMPAVKEPGAPAPEETEPETEGSPGIEAGPHAGTDAGTKAPEPDTEASGTQAGEPAGQEGISEPDEQIVPEVVTEPEKPQRLVNSGRTSYNAANAPAQEASMDDILGMMGDGM